MMGAQVDLAANPMPLLRHVKHPTVWIENPIGSGTVSYTMQQLGLDVVGNDISKYSYYLVLSVHGRNTRVRELSYDIEGYASNLGYFKPEVARFIDTIAEQGEPIQKAALGASLIKLITFRGLAVAEEYMQNLALDELEKSYKLKLKRLIDYANYPRPGRLLGMYNMDWLEFLETHRFNYRGCWIMLSDFAWPYHPKIQRGTSYDAYKGLFFISLLVSGGRQEKPKSIWTYENIETELKRFLERVQNTGAPVYILNTQDTNYPEPARVGELLDEWGYTDKVYVKLLHRSTRPGQWKGDHYWLIFFDKECWAK